MAHISKIAPGLVEKPGVPGRVAGGRFASGANNVASAQDGAIGEIGTNNSVSSRDRSFLYQDYAERHVEDQPQPEEEPPAIDGSGLNKAPILEAPNLAAVGQGYSIGSIPQLETADLATRVAGSYQSVADKGQTDVPAPGRQLSLKL